MASELKWSRRDKKRAQEVLKQLSEHHGGWQGLADALGMQADSSRATVQAWHRRGRVPVAQLQQVLTLAGAAEVQCTAAELSPQARHLEKLA